MGMSLTWVPQKKIDFTLGETLNPKTLMNIPQMEVVGPHENYKSVSIASLSLSPY